jgi:hypothetical protein
LVGGLFIVKRIIEVSADFDKFEVAYLHPKKYEKKEEHKVASFKIDKDIKVSVDSGDFRLFPEGFEILNFKNLSLQLSDKSKIDKKEDTISVIKTEPDTKPLMIDKVAGIGLTINPLCLSEFGVIGSIKILDSFLIQASFIQKDLFKESKILANFLFLL